MMTMVEDIKMIMAVDIKMIMAVEVTHTEQTHTLEEVIAMVVADMLINQHTLWIHNT
jgi:hypothetical protein